MTLTTIKIFFLIAFVGHLLCCFCDRSITYTPNGRFNFKYLNDNSKLSELFNGTPLKNQLFSIIGGVFALIMSTLGYIAVYEYITSYSSISGIIMLIAIVLLIVAGTAHHVFCGAIEWFYIRMGRTEEARKAIVEFFKKTSVTMLLCYIGFLVFSVTLFVAILSGLTDLPRWVCVFNVVPIFALLLPFRIVGSFNIASATMFLSLFIVFCFI